jgi:hypothetical protein
MKAPSLILPSRSLIVVPQPRIDMPSRRGFFRRAGSAALLAPLALLPAAAQASTTDNYSYGAYVAMTVTNLQSLATDSTDVFAGWQSARVDNQTTTKAIDYEIAIRLTTANTSPGGDQAVYVYLVPWVTTDGGSTWNPAANFGTTTLPSGSEGTANMSEPNSMKGPIAIPYKIAQQLLSGFFTVSQLCGGVVPDGWSLALRNNCGAALSTGCVVEYRPITLTNG